MNEKPYTDTTKRTNTYTGSQKVTKESSSIQRSSKKERDITEEQISDTVVEGTIDVKLKNTNEEETCK